MFLTIVVTFKKILPYCCCFVVDRQRNSILAFDLFVFTHKTQLQRRTYKKEKCQSGFSHML